jgi:hypothetical protein
LVGLGFPLVASLFLLCKMGAKTLALLVLQDFYEKQKSSGGDSVVQITNEGVILKPALC